MERYEALFVITEVKLTLLQDPELGRVFDERSVSGPVHLGRRHAFDAAL